MFLMKMKLSISLMTFFISMTFLFNPTAWGETGFPLSLERHVFTDLHDLTVSAALVVSEEGKQTLVERQAKWVRRNAQDSETVIEFGDEARLTLRARLRRGDDPKSARLETQVEMEHHGKRPIALARLSLHLPLRLQERKRVVQAGEGGVLWETRSRYQFHTLVSRSLLAEPDTNIWRIFRSEWAPGDTYTLARWESLHTAPFILHRGTGFPGWIAVYDQRGGVAVALDEADFRTERALEVQTENGGALTIDLHPASALPAPLPGSGESFKDVLAVNFRVFEESSAKSIGDGLARRPLVSGPPRDRPKVAPSTLLAISGGVPFAAGVLKPADRVELRMDKGGLPVPLQSAPLAYWPDGSVKWLELIFPADPEVRADAATPGGEAVAKFQVGEGTGRARSFSLFKKDDSQPSPPGPLTVTRSDGEIRIDTGAIQASFVTGKNWWRSLQVAGRPVLAAESGVCAYLEMTTAQTPPEPGERRLRGTVERASLVAEKIEVEESGPVRAVIRIEGETDGAYPCRMTVRLTFFAGSPAIQGSHTWVVGAFDPRTVFVTALGFDFNLLTKASAAEVAADVEGRRVWLPLAEGVSLSALHPDASEIITRSGDQLERRFAGAGIADALEVATPEVGLTAVLRDMRKMFPSGLAAEPDARGVRLSVEFWPRNAGPMDLRRYSDLPHRGQSESVPVSHDWVSAHYYPEDPVRGISRTQEFLLVPWSKAQPSLSALTAALEDRPLIYSGEKTYLQTGVLANDLSDPSFVPARQTLTDFAKFLEFHRQKWRWFGKWTYGDIQHSFKRGYGRIVKPDILADLLKRKETRLPPGSFVTDYRPQNDWASDNGRWGWTNTEGLPNRYLSELYLRTGDRAIFFAMEAQARQSRDVIIRHEGRWFGGGTRHGVQPWSDGCHQERMTIPSEYRLHRLLTGDKRSRDVLYRYGYDVFLQPKSTFIQGTAPLVQVKADHSARFYGLLTLWEATGDPNVGAALDRYASLFVVPEGIATEPTVEFPQVRPAEPPREINSGGMFFPTFGAMYALSEYAELTGNKALTEGICRMAAAALANPIAYQVLTDNLSNASYFYWPAIAFAARHAEDAETYLDLIRTWAGGSGAVSVRQVVTHSPAHWSGPTGFLRDGFMSIVLFRLNNLPALLAPLGTLPDANPSEMETLKRQESEGQLRPETRLSWQHEYDRPDLRNYLTTQPEKDKPNPAGQLKSGLQ